MQSTLIVQTARPDFIIQAIESIREKDLLGSVRITLFCRGKAEELSVFQNIDWLDEIVVHHETDGSFRHLIGIRKLRFDIVIIFLTGDPSYWKIKIFSFFCRGRHLLIFNEHLGCFFYTRKLFFKFLNRRLNDWFLRRRQQLGSSLGTSQGHVVRSPSFGKKLLRPFHLILKLVVFPLRFLYLFGWCRTKEHLRLRAINSNTFPFSKEEMN